MRLPLLTPDQLSDEQKKLYADMKDGIQSKFNAFEAVSEAGELLGPWNPWLHAPRIGGAIWDLTKAMSMEATLPEESRQVAILVTGARYDAAYEIYAHVAVGKVAGLDEATMSTICSGSRPSNLSKEAGVAYDVAYVLAGGKQLPRVTYDLAIETCGQKGAQELIYLVGLYCLVSVVLNGFAVPVPAEAQ